MKLKYCLFDLDGTLTDSGEGITASVAYALESMGYEVPSVEALNRFVGPPLDVSFRQFYGFDEAQIKAAVERFREYFVSKGIYQNKVYPGIPALLQTLSQSGICLAIASSKPQQQVLDVLSSFAILGYFTVVSGGDGDAAGTPKEIVVENALRDLAYLEQNSHLPASDEAIDNISYESILPLTVMVGDTLYDMRGANAFGLRGIGVSYGYGLREEIAAEGAFQIVDTVSELESLLLTL